MHNPSGNAFESIEIDGMRFHLVWLRDNCPCGLCQDPGTLQKLFDITATGLKPHIQNLSQDEQFIYITWDESPPHRTTYSRSWMRSHAYDRKPPEEPDEIELWHGSRWEFSQPKAYRMDEATGWGDEVRRYGFALLKDIEENQLIPFLSSIGPIQPTEFGQVAPLRARPDANDLGETGYPLDPHTDYSVYMHFPPVLSFLHCIRNESDGGMSILVDGFAAAEHFRREDAAGFDLLTRTGLPFHQLYGRWRYHHMRIRPVIEIDDADQVTGIHAGHPHTRNWRFPFDEMAALYHAYSRFTRLLNDPSRQIRYRLQAGECLVFRNERVLHGRTGFSAGTGERHLQVAYVNYSYFDARRRFEQAEGVGLA